MGSIIGNNAGGKPPRAALRRQRQYDDGFTAGFVRAIRETQALLEGNVAPGRELETMTRLLARCKKFSGDGLGSEQLVEMVIDDAVW
jgi:hypothetical protein